MVPGPRMGEPKKGADSKKGKGNKVKKTLSVKMIRKSSSVEENENGSSCSLNSDSRDHLLN